jgi:hypothetical protein
MGLHEGVRPCLMLPHLIVYKHILSSVIIAHSLCFWGVELTTLPPTVQTMWDPQHLTTL